MAEFLEDERLVYCNVWRSERKKKKKKKKLGNGVNEIKHGEC